jgi:tRNA A-37 threonylcarbamoyl transferase component Bud32
MTRDANDSPRDDSPREKPSGMPEPGAIFAEKYQIGGMIGQGAMAVVLEATHLQLRDRVAIKLLLPEWAKNPELVERFMREGRAATRIRSEHVVRVFDVGVSDGHPYLVMEYLDGKDLDQVVAQEGHLSAETAIDYLLQACEAIAEAHVRGIIHRDLKPANLFLTRRADGSACVKVLDFGISKALEELPADMRATSPSAVMGSPHYMSPEQMLSAADVDVRSDIWALGAILYELLVGSPPFDGDTFAALSAAVLRDTAPLLTVARPDVPAGIAAVVARCLDKEPARRFANVAELAGALAELGSDAARASAERIARVLEGGAATVSVRAPRVAERTERSGRAISLVGRRTVPPLTGRGPVLGYAIAAVAFLGVGSTIVWMIVKDDQAIHAAEQREQADAAAASASANAATLTSGASSGVPSAEPSAPLAAAEPNAHAHGHETPSAPQVQASGAPVTPVHAPIHARWPRRGPHTPGRNGPPPLPDFPIPTASPSAGKSDPPPLPNFPVPSDPQGEPSSRPLQTAPGPAGASPPPASTATPSLPTPTGN